MLSTQVPHLSKETCKKKKKKRMLVLYWNCECCTVLPFAEHVHRKNDIFWPIFA